MDRCLVARTMTCCSSLTPLTSAKTSPAHPFSTSPRHGSLGSLSSSVEYERSTERLAAVCEGLCRPTEARLGGAIGAGNVGSVAARRISFGPLRQARPCAEDCFNDEDIVYRCLLLDLVMLGADLGVPRLVANRHFVANNERKRTSKPCREQLHDASATSYKMTLFTK